MGASGIIPLTAVWASRVRSPRLGIGLRTLACEAPEGALEAAALTLALRPSLTPDLRPSATPASGSWDGVLLGSLNLR